LSVLDSLGRLTKTNMNSMVLTVDPFDTDAGVLNIAVSFWDR
jgi:hypothetical protein